MNKNEIAAQIKNFVAHMADNNVDTVVFALPTGTNEYPFHCHTMDFDPMLSIFVTVLSECAAAETDPAVLNRWSNIVKTYSRNFDDNAADTDMSKSENFADAEVTTGCLINVLFNRLNAALHSDDKEIRRVNRVALINTLNLLNLLAEKYLKEAE